MNKKLFIHCIKFWEVTVLVSYWTCFIFKNLSTIHIIPLNFNFTFDWKPKVMPPCIHKCVSLQIIFYCIFCSWLYNLMFMLPDAAVTKWISRFANTHMTDIQVTNIQCESKKSPQGVLTFLIFLTNGWEFLIDFYTPITHSYLR